MTRVEYETAVARFRRVPGGIVREKDFFVPDRRPYRHAWVRLERPRIDFADEAREMALLTEETEGHMSLSIHPGLVWMEVAVTRDLSEAEIGDDPPVATRAVT